MSFKNTLVDKSNKPKISNEAGFNEVLKIIHQGRNKAFKTVNTILIETYWTVVRYLSEK